MGAAGIATASAAAGWVNATLLFGVLVRRGHWGSDPGLVRRTPRIILSSALMAGAVYLAAASLQPQLASDAPIYVQAPALAAIVLGGMVLYFAAAFGLGGADMGMIRRNIRRKGDVPPEAPGPD
jgi:putative peptidoglycan lipid II flippase